MHVGDLMASKAREGVMMPPTQHDITRLEGAIASFARDTRGNMKELFKRVSELEGGHKVIEAEFKHMNSSISQLGTEQKELFGVIAQHMADEDKHHEKVRRIWWVGTGVVITLNVLLKYPEIANLINHLGG